MLLYIDGFAHQNTGRYVGTGTSVSSWGTSSGRVTNYSVVGQVAKSFTAAAEIFLGVGYKASAFGSSSAVVTFYGDTNATAHITVMVNGSGLIEVRRGTTGGTLLATGTTTIAANAWHYYEIRVVISDTVGVVQVRLDGSTSNEINLTSADTKNAGTNTSVDTARLGFGSPSTMADLYILDTTGSVNNTWRGDVVVRQLVPTGDGDLSQLLGSDGNSVNNWQQVDELPASATDYNASPTSGQEDTYAITDLPAAATTVYGVQVNASILKSDAGASSANLVTRVAGTDYLGSTRALSTSLTEYNELRETNPATSAQWTVSEVNALQVGMKVA